IDSGKISGKQGKEVFAEMFATGKRAAAIVKEKGIKQLSDLSAIEELCDEVISANPNAAADFKAGNGGPLNFLRGQVMKSAKGSGQCAGGRRKDSGRSARGSAGSKDRHRADGRRRRGDRGGGFRRASWFVVEMQSAGSVRPHDRGALCVDRKTAARRNGNE